MLCSSAVFISRLVMHKIMTRCLLQICGLFRGGNIILAGEMETVEESGVQSTATHKDYMETMIKITNIFTTLFT